MNTTTFKKELETALKAITGISFTIDYQKESEGAVFEIKFNYDNFKEVEDNWIEKVDNALSELYATWGGSFYWEGNVVYYSFSNKK